MLHAHRPYRLIAAQGAIGAFALAALALTPPAQGRMMIVSLNGQSPGEIAAWAVRDEVRIVGSGPLPGSLIVQADAGGLARRAMRHGDLVLAAPAAGCGWGRTT